MEPSSSAAFAAAAIGTDPAQLRHKYDVLRRHCEAVGRDYAEIEKTFLTQVSITPTRLWLMTLVGPPDWPIRTLPRGASALEALDIAPTCVHMNEGHSAFSALERIRGTMVACDCGFDEAVEIGGVQPTAGSALE